MGVGTEVSFPIGSTASGNEGVAEIVKRDLGSIGYVELAFAFHRELPFGLVRNRENEFVKAILICGQGGQLAGLTNVPDDLRFSLTDPPGQGSYPICGATWAVVRVKQPADKKKHLVDFLTPSGRGRSRRGYFIKYRRRCHAAEGGEATVENVMIPGRLVNLI